jgi:hypothetical protein
MKKLLAACLIAAPLAIASLAFAADTAAPASTPAKVTSTAPTESGEGFAPGPTEYRIPINGCTATVTCPRTSAVSSVSCIGHTPTGCVARQTATPPWVACDGIAHTCPVLIP